MPVNLLRGLFAGALLTALMTSCAGLKKTQPTFRQTTVFPSHTIFPSTKALPKATIEDLPRRIRAIPAGNPMTLQKLVNTLGLFRYKNNVSANFRGGTYFMHLDDNHILYFHTDTSTIPKPPKDSFVLATAWQAKIVQCSMHKNPDITVVERDMGERQLEISSGMRDPQSAPD